MTIYRKNNSAWTYAVGALVAIAFVAAATLGVSSALHIEKTTINVVSKERLQKIISDSDGKITSMQEYWVYSDEDTYRVADSFIQWHFYSGQVYAEVKEGAICDVTLQGYRIGLLSMMQNIIEVECK